jgi:hypothetical protein
LADSLSVVHSYIRYRDRPRKGRGGGGESPPPENRSGYPVHALGAEQILGRRRTIRNQTELLVGFAF